MYRSERNGCTTGRAKADAQDRLQCIATIVDIIPTDSLQLIPELLSEAVLGTKEVNEKARDAGFDLLVVMANKMAQGGTVVQGGQSCMSLSPLCQLTTRRSQLGRLP
jgi:ribosomal RNA-processing protein 12